MTEQLSNDEKYQYIKDTYGKDADKILSKYGALAYDIDKYLAKKAKVFPKTYAMMIFLPNSSL